MQTDKIYTKEQEIQELMEENWKLKNQLLQIEENHAREMELIFNSTSWKITRPYRFFSKIIKKIAKLFLSEKIRHGFYVLLHDGPRQFLRKAHKYTKDKVVLKNYIKRVVHPDEEILKMQRNTTFPKTIKFSIIVPLYNTPEEYLVQMIASCQQQTYGDWELCLADGSDSEHAYVGDIVKKMAEKDGRIQYQVLKENNGISENTNSAMQMATGDYIALLDHDDLLHPSALFKYMEVICEKNADFIYSDEMTFEVEPDNARTLHFKPDYALDNLRANNYICHFSVFSKRLLSSVGTFRKEYDGSQDHDMILRLTERAEKIVHVPEILYFWRSHPASVASDISSKTYAITAGIKAVSSHLERMGIRANVESSEAFPAIYRIHYELLSKPLISILIPSQNDVTMLVRCIDAIFEKSTYDNYEVIVIDNNSKDAATVSFYQKLSKNDKIQVITSKKTVESISTLYNLGARHAKGEHIIFLNRNVNIISPGWVEELLAYSQRKDVGAAGAKLYYPNGKIEHGGIILGLGKERCGDSAHHGAEKDNLGYMGRLSYSQDVTAVSWNCMMVAKDKFISVGGFREDYVSLYADIDLCLRLQGKGYLNIWTPYVEAYHYKRSLLRTKRTNVKLSDGRLFRKVWKEQLASGDPYYNVNFSLDTADFSLGINR